MCVYSIADSAASIEIESLPCDKSSLVSITVLFPFSMSPRSSLQVSSDVRLSSSISSSVDIERVVSVCDPEQHSKCSLPSVCAQ
eukprot:scaffold3166_cov95-Skeletonema_menzelii.AAC.1